MIAEIAATVSSLKLLGDVIGKMKESAEKSHALAAFGDTQDKFIVLRNTAILARESESAALERARIAEEEIVRLNDWSADAER